MSRLLHPIRFGSVVTHRRCARSTCVSSRRNHTFGFATKSRWLEFFQKTLNYNSIRYFISCSWARITLQFSKMASSNNRIRSSLITVVALWAMSILVQCEATTVSLTTGPYSNSRRKSFGSSGWTTRRSQLAPALLDDDELASEDYKEVEECGVSSMKNFVSFFIGFNLLHYLQWPISVETVGNSRHFVDTLIFAARKKFGTRCFSPNSIGFDRRYTFGVD